MHAAEPLDVRFLAPSQVAELLSLSVEEVLALVHDGLLRAARLGVPARWRIEETSVRHYVEDRLEEARLMRLWRQSQDAALPELWIAPAHIAG